MQFSLAALLLAMGAVCVVCGAVRVVAGVFADLLATPGDSLFLSGLGLVGFISAVSLAGVFSDL